jgi:ribosomal protein L37E
MKKNKTEPKYRCKRCKEPTRVTYDGNCEHCNLGKKNKSEQTSILDILR